MLWQSGTYCFSDQLNFKVPGGVFWHPPRTKYLERSDDATQSLTKVICIQHRQQPVWDIDIDANPYARGVNASEYQEMDDNRYWDYIRPPPHLAKEHWRNVIHGYHMVCLSHILRCFSLHVLWYRVFICRCDSITQQLPLSVSGSEAFHTLNF